MKKKSFAGLIITIAAVAVVFAARQSSGPLAAGVPSYRIQGPAGAPVTIVVFSDFQCPNCATAEPVLKDLVSRHAGKVRFFFRHRPLRMHEWSVPAARAAEAAGFQGKFWEYHDILFQRQKDWAVPGKNPEAMFLGYAREAGLDADRFSRDVRSDRVQALLQAEARAAQGLGVDATPTIFINGERRIGAAQLSSDGERLIELGGG